MDQHSGPFQNETGSDGIRDHSHIIYENNQDNYPLTEAIPEFPSWVSMLLIFLVLTVVTAIYRFEK
ncbi:MAG: hypothetical protein O2V44_06080 [Candidatus Bathyarchaeota archaeon]|nr:hypothetical protein [Candidatus Bathyarchaeota archaeon]